MSDEVSKLELSDLDGLREVCKGDLYVFAKGILQHDWLVPHVHRPLCRLLELYNGYDESLAPPMIEYWRVLSNPVLELSLERRWDIFLNGLKRALIVLPRGWLKTTVCSVSYPMWRAVRDPNIRVLLTQNTILM